MKHLRLPIYEEKKVYLAHSFGGSNSSQHSIDSDTYPPPAFPSMGHLMADCRGGSKQSHLERDVLAGWGQTQALQQTSLEN